MSEKNDLNQQPDPEVFGKWNSIYFMGWGSGEFPVYIYINGNQVVVQCHTPNIYEFKYGGGFESYFFPQTKELNYENLIVFLKEQTMIGFYKDRWPMEKMHAMGKEEFLTEVKNAGYKW